MFTFYNVFTEDVEEIVIDKSRNILYTRDRCSTIQMFDLGDDGQQCVLVGTFTAKQIAVSPAFPHTNFTMMFSLCYVS